MHMFSFEGAVRAYPDRYTKPYAVVAQLAEQLTCNQQVVGSIPIASSNNKIRRSSRVAKGGRL